MVEPPRQPLWPWICKNYIGPGPYPGVEDREVASFDGQVLILKWVNPEVAGRYGIMVLARCGSPALRLPPRTP
jgi:hypothetical protein